MIFHLKLSPKIVFFKSITVLFEKYDHKFNIFGRKLSVFLIVPFVIGIILPNSTCVIVSYVSRQHLEGSIILRWVIWHVAFFSALPNAQRITFGLLVEV